MTAMPNDRKKCETLELSPNVVDQLKQLANEPDAVTALKKIVQTVAYLKQESKNGSDIVISKKDGSKQTLSFQ